jgi:hypothetical protein
MLKRCNPQTVEKAYQKTRSWRKTARALNELYNVSLSHASWRDYAKGKHDIADAGTRARLLLGPRACPGCGRKHSTRKRTTAKRIREYGYPKVEVKPFDEVLKLCEAIR